MLVDSRKDQHAAQTVDGLDGLGQKTGKTAGNLEYAREVQFDVSVAVSDCLVDAEGGGTAVVERKNVALQIDAETGTRFVHYLKPLD